MSQPTFQSLFYSPQFLPRLCSFTFLFSSFAAGLETHWNYSEFSKCLHGCLGCFLGYSIPTEFYSHSTWWLGGCWQQVLVVIDRVALDDFAVFHSAKTQSSQNTDFSPLISTEVSHSSNSHKHWSLFIPTPKDNRDGISGQDASLGPVCVLKWTCNISGFCGNFTVSCVILFSFKPEQVKL